MSSNEVLSGTITYLTLGIRSIIFKNILILSESTKIVSNRVDSTIYTKASGSNVSYNGMIVLLVWLQANSRINISYLFLDKNPMPAIYSPSTITSLLSPRFWIADEAPAKSHLAC